MMQALLADRFKLTIHREMRDCPVYALVVARNGPKLVASPDGKFSVSQRTGHLEMRAVFTHVLADYLWSTHASARPVVDMTEPKGPFDVALDRTPDEVRANAADSGPSVFTAIQEQLGLKLEPRRAPFDFIVIDHVERPSAN